MALNKHSKGTRNVRKARKYLEELGYSVHTEKHGKWDTDIYGLFDGIATPKTPFKRPIYFQVKSNQFPSQKPFKAFKREHFEIEIWLMVWFDRKGWTIRKI